MSKTDICLDETEFTPTLFHTAADKLRFARQFVRFVEAGMPASKFPKWFYSRLSNTRGHIAHYSHGGFYDEWFSTPEKRLRFLAYWSDDARMYGDPAYTFSDVERVLQRWIVANYSRLVAMIQRIGQEEEKARLDAAQQEEARRACLIGANTQKFLIVAKSQNTGPFGHYGYIVVARDGCAYQLERTCCYHWRVGETIDAPLDGQRLPVFSGFAVEIAKRLPSPPMQAVEQAWAGK